MGTLGGYYNLNENFCSSIRVGSRGWVGVKVREIAHNACMHAGIIINYQTCMEVRQTCCYNIDHMSFKNALSLITCG